ncbi:MAG: hypothetical protein R3B90_07700 [Planctomycetaceae bacterium]
MSRRHQQQRRLGRSRNTCRPGPAMTARAIDSRLVHLQAGDSVISTRSLWLPLACALVVLATLLLTNAAFGEDAAPTPSAATTGKSAQLRFEQALDQPIAVEFINTELGQVIAYLQDRYQIPILPSEDELSRIGVDLADSVNLVVAGIPMRDVLEMILEPRGLGLLIENGVLKITSAIVVDSTYETRVYRVHQLNPLTAEMVVEIIHQTIAQPSWHQAPGRLSQGAKVTIPPGVRLMELTSGGGLPAVPGGQVDPNGGQPPLRSSLSRPAIVAVPGGFVMTHNQPVHRQVAQLLEQLNDLRAPEVPMSPIQSPATNP